MDTKAVWPLVKSAYNEWSEDKASRLAASLAYYTAISLAPLLVLAVTVLGWLQFEGRMVVENQMAMLMGPTGREAATTMIDAAKQSSGLLATIVSLIILLFGASGVFAELQDSMNTIWEVQPKPNLSWWDMIKARFLSMTMVFGVIFLMLVSMVITTVISGMVKRYAGEARIIGLMLDVVLSLIVYTGIFMLLFKYLPDVNIKFRDVWLGAVLTAVLFTIGKYLLTLYLTMGSTASAYGAAGSLAALLIWVYYSAQILFFGAEFTQVHARLQEGVIKPTEVAVPITEERRAQQGIVRQHDLETSTQAAAMLSEKRGAVYGETVPRRRVVTITKPADRGKAFAVASVGIATGFIVGLLGLNKGRRFVREGVEEVRLRERLGRIETEIAKVTGVEFSNGKAEPARSKDPWETIKQGARNAWENVRKEATS